MTDHDAEVPLDLSEAIDIASGQREHLLWIDAWLPRQTADERKTTYGGSNPRSQHRTHRDVLSSVGSVVAEQLSK